MPVPKLPKRATFRDWLNTLRDYEAVNDCRLDDVAYLYTPAGDHVLCELLEAEGDDVMPDRLLVVQTEEITVEG